MGITRDRGDWSFVKRAPKRFAHVDPWRKVTRALWTDSEREARIKAAAVEKEIVAHWDALAAGNAGDARAADDAARRLSRARGFPCRPAALEGFVQFSAIERQSGKSERQIRRWKQPRLRAVAAFVMLNSDLAMYDIRRILGQKLRHGYRRSWEHRWRHGNLTPWFRISTSRGGSLEVRKKVIAQVAIQRRSGVMSRRGAW